MTKIDYVNFVCSKLHRTDNPSKDEARQYCRLRYQTLYDSRAWRDTQSIFATNISTTQVHILPYIIDRVIGVRWGDHIPLINEQLWAMLTIDPSVFDDVGDPGSFSIYSPSAVALPPGGGKISISTTVSAPDFHVSIYGVKNSEERSESIYVTGLSTIESANEYDEIITLAKSNETHDLVVRRLDTSVQILYLKPYEKKRTHQRLHLHSTPRTEATSLVLCKRKHQPLVNDFDSPEDIRGIETALLAFLEGDMLESGRHYGKAQLKYQEAAMAAMAMADLERHQSANVVRIIPHEGSAEGVDIYPSKANFFG